jgi:CBS domain-containing protein
MNNEASSSADALGRLSGRTVRDFANIGIYAVTPEAPLGEVAWLMASNRVHAVLVTDDQAPEPPVIADADLIAAASSGHFDELRARDIAATEGVSVDEGESLARAAQLLAEHGVSHLVVRDRRRYPVGILSTLDLARAISGRR